MKSIIRALPALAAAFILGAMIMSPAFAHATAKQRTTEVGLLIAFAFAAWVLAALVTRGKRQPEQRPSFGQPTPRRRIGAGRN